MHVACCCLLDHLVLFSFMLISSIFPSIFACCLLKLVLSHFYSPQISLTNVTFLTFVPCFLGPDRCCYIHPCLLGPRRYCYIHAINIYFIHMHSADVPVSSCFQFLVQTNGNSSSRACPNKFAVSLSIVS